MIKIFLKATAGIAIVLTFVCCSSVQPAYDNTVNAQPEVMQQPGEPVSIQTFYDELEPYGQWIDDQQMGYVWVPNAGPEFRPYATNGHWVETQYGNTWVSDYPWGWAAFHYGRWRHDNYYGWEWIPGTEWGPAWVNWRSGGDYYGWAPLEPGIDISVSLGSGYYAPDNYWVFVPRQYVCSPNVYQYYLPPTRNYAVIQNTTIINNVYNDNNRRYVVGPRPDEIQRYSGNRVNVYNINNSGRPGSTFVRNNTINIYRPQIVTNGNGNNRPAPNRVVSRGNFDPGNSNNRNPAYNNNTRPVNQGNNTFQGNNNPGNTSNGFGGRRNYGNNNPSNGNQNQQPATNPTLNNPGSAQTSASGNVNGNNPSNNFGRPARSNQPTQAATNSNSQPNGNGWPSRSPDNNRNRNNNQVLQNQQQQGQQRQQLQVQQNQQNQQNQQQMLQRQQQQRQQQIQQNQQRQQQQQQRQQQIQQRQQQQNNQQQRPVREEVQERHPQR